MYILELIKNLQPTECKYLYDYLEAQGVILDKNIITPEDNGISASDTIENSNNEILF